MMSVTKSVWSFEPAFLAHITGVSMIFLVLQEFLEEKSCKVNLGYPDRVCHALKTSKATDYPTEAREVQKLLGTELSTRTMIENAFPILLVFLLGPWSDRHGRKFPLLVVIFGFLLQSLILSTFAYFQEGNTGAWPIALTSSLVISLSGNQQCFMMAAFSYITENVPFDKMTLRMGIMQSFCFLGFFLGLTGSGFLIKSNIGFVNIFLIAFMLETFAFLYLFFMVNEMPRGVVNENRSKCEIFMELFDWNHVKDAFHSVFRRREGNDRFKLLVLLFVHSCTLVPMYGEYAVTYLFCQLNFNWDIQTYGSFMTYTIVAGFVSNFIATWIVNNVLNLSDPAIGIVGMISCMVSSLMLAFATSGNIMYFGPIVGFLAGPAFSVPRSVISKIVTANELGKVNSFIASLESLVPFVASPIYTFTYSTFLDVFPGSFFLISASCTIPSIVIYWYDLLANEQPDSSKSSRLSQKLSSLLPYKVRESPVMSTTEMFLSPNML